MRAQLVVGSMNACFKRPQVEASRQGRARVGAASTADGKTVLASHRRLEA